MTKTTIYTIVMACLVTIACWYVVNSEPVSVPMGTERYWQQVIHDEIGGVTEYRLSDGTRVDILLDDWAVEIDFQHKWAEAIGQATYYGLRTSRRPLVILLGTDGKWKRYSDRVTYCGVSCWVFDTRTEKWVKREN